MASYYHYSYAFLILFFSFLFVSCEQPQVQPKPEGYALGKIIQEQSYWEGNSIEAAETFFIDNEQTFCLAETKKAYSGVVKIRARNGTVKAIRSYINGLPEGDFYEWHENGNLKSMQQYKNGLKHGFFYIWTTKNVIFSRRFYRDGREDFSKFEDEGIAQTGASLASVELKEWEGTGPQFYQKFAGDPNRDGTVWIRETEELYTGTITALDDMGRKEAVLNFSKGKYNGTIYKWDEDGSLWEQGEFSRGTLVAFTVKEGKPFNPDNVIDLFSDPSRASMLFAE